VMAGLHRVRRLASTDPVRTMPPAASGSPSHPSSPSPDSPSSPTSPSPAPSLPDWRIVRVEPLVDSVAVRISRSSSAGTVTTDVRMPLPPAYPAEVNVPDSPLGAPRQKLMLDAKPVASALVERVSSLAKLRARMSIRNDSRSSTKGSSVAEFMHTKELLWQSLGNSGLLSPWRLVANHARPLLASSLEPGNRYRVLEAVYAFEDIAAALEFYGLPVELPLQSVHPPQQPPSLSKTRASGREVVVELGVGARGLGHRLPTPEEWQVVRATGWYTLFPIEDFAGVLCPATLASYTVPRGLKGTIRLPDGLRPRKAWIVIDSGMRLGKAPPLKLWLSIWVKINERLDLRVGSHLSVLGPQQAMVLWNSVDPLVWHSGDNHVSVRAVSLVPSSQIGDLGQRFPVSRPDGTGLVPARDVTKMAVGAMFERLSLIIE